MPEGHILHRAARLQGKKLVGRRVTASSPQGRFSSGAAQVDGQMVTAIEARGKHLFYQFANELSVHVHLGLFGKFRIQRQPFPEPSRNARLLLSTDSDRIHLAGPTTCQVLEPDEVEAVLARLGPDPLAPTDGGAEQLSKALARRSVPIGRALLDQRAIAGLGNVYRSELLFMVGLDPFTPSSKVPPEVVTQIWDLSVTELRAGERSGRIVTVDPGKVGKASRSKLTRTERLYAYKRHGQACRSCEDTIVTAEIDDRSIWWCPTCQTSPESLSVDR